MSYEDWKTKKINVLRYAATAVNEYIPIVCFDLQQSNPSVDVNTYTYAEPTSLDWLDDA